MDVFTFIEHMAQRVKTKMIGWLWVEFVVGYS